jgi:hypothetical protein
MTIMSNGVQQAWTGRIDLGQKSVKNKADSNQ